jgi:hypothetical protein
MNELEYFEIKISEIRSIHGEYEGNFDSGKVIIFCHGFGVRRDSRTLFTDIGDAFKKDFGIVRFDFEEFNDKEKSITIGSIKYESVVLENVIEFIQNKFKPKSIDLISHSLGSIVACDSTLKGVNKLILLAGSPSNSYERLKLRFSDKEGSILDEDGLSIWERADGSKTIIKKEFWAELKSIVPIESYRKVVHKVDTYYIRALNDDKLKTDDDFEKIRYITGMKYFEVDGNHNFDGEDRKSLVRLLQNLLV